MTNERGIRFTAGDCLRQARAEGMSKRSASVSPYSIDTVDARTLRPGR
jgi:hypothetical protein